MARYHPVMSLTQNFYGKLTGKMMMEYTGDEESVCFWRFVYMNGVPMVYIQLQTICYTDIQLISDLTQHQWDTHAPCTGEVMTESGIYV